MVRPPSTASLVLLPLLAFGCSAAKSTVAILCEPPCPTGTRCTETGCVFEGSPIDLGAAAGTDLAGTCQPPCSGSAPYCYAGVACVPCLDDAHCPPGNICRAKGASSACVPGCHDDERCRGRDGGPAMRCCAGACVDTGSDPANCGACGASCGGPQALPVCTSGVCGPGPCLSGWGDCNLDPADGCETNLRTTVEHCTACGRACSFPNAIAGCANGCYLAGCAFGFDDCDAQTANGCEASILSDVRNCGACGNACPAAPHASVSCQNTACRIAKCDAGFADCDGNRLNGCEVTVLTDAANCGACGASCAQGLVCRAAQCTCPQCNIPNASSKCANNVCIIDRCNAGFSDCDGDIKNGCEVNTLVDPTSCGQCNFVCPMDKPTCDRGSCSTIPGPIINYDAADARSYPGQGVTWTDLAGSGVNGTLINNVTFGSLANVKTLIFDGAGAGVTFPNAKLDENTFGAVYWVYSQVPMFVADQGGLYVNWTRRDWNPPNWVAFFKWAADDWYFRVNNGNCCQDLPGSGMGGFAKNIPQNRWTMVHFFYQIGTMNGWKWGTNGQNVSVSTMNSRSPGQSEPTSVIGWGHPMEGGYWIGGISSVRFYNVLLTDDQLASLYASTKGSYGQ